MAKLFRRRAISTASPTLDEHIDQNIENVVALQKREEQAVGAVQRWAERISKLVGRPFYLVVLLSSVLGWAAANMLLPPSWRWDPIPFPFLDGFISLISLVTTTIVLIAQNRQTKLEQQHSQLGLQVALLTEQKVSKLIDLIEELRRDMPMVRDRHDPGAEAFRKSADTAKVAAALAEVGAIRTGTVASTNSDSPKPKEGLAELHWP